MFNLAAIIAFALEALRKYYLISATIIISMIVFVGISTFYIYAIHRIDNRKRESWAFLETYPNILELAPSQPTFNGDHTLIDDGNTTSNPWSVLIVESFSFSHEYLVSKACYC
jgi:hypothetical protein